MTGAGALHWTWLRPLHGAGRRSTTPPDGHTAAVAWATLFYPPVILPSVSY